MLILLRINTYALPSKKPSFLAQVISLKQGKYFAFKKSAF
jgi:hypothetical protein